MQATQNSGALPCSEVKEGMEIIASYTNQIINDWKTGSKDARQALDLRDRIIRFLTQRSNLQVDSFELKLELDEMVSNAFKHGYGTVEITIYQDRDGYLVTASNETDCCWSEITEPKDPLDCTEGGFGRIILDRLAQNVYSESLFDRLFTSELRVAA